MRNQTPLAPGESSDVTVHIVLNDFGNLGRAYVETEIVVPPGGLGKQLDRMYDWHRARGIEAYRGRGRREEARDIIRWCFAHATTAAAFAAAFGGVT